VLFHVFTFVFIRHKKTKLNTQKTKLNTQNYEICFFPTDIDIEHYDVSRVCVCMYVCVHICMLYTDIEHYDVSRVCMYVCVCVYRY